tara:strand:- start:1446 stop:1712 length:267 start_codon:yes stop_codon:yes gene_type:complete
MCFYLNTIFIVPPFGGIIIGKNMFKWFKNKEKDLKQPHTIEKNFEDSIEEALWEVKEQFDLETEEVEKTVLDKRQNIEYMRKTLKRDI